MKVEDLYSVEIEGISNTIQSYAVEYFIESYTKQLKHYSLPQDYDKIKSIIESLVDWYDKHIDNIRNSRFVMNKEEHEKSNNLLIELYQQLNQYRTD